jgi:hypothetical protein
MKALRATAIVILALATSHAHAQQPPPAQAVALTPTEQKMVDQWMAPLKLDPKAIVSALELAATPLRELLDAIAKATGLPLRYDSTVVAPGPLSVDPNGLRFVAVMGGESRRFTVRATPAMITEIANLIALHDKK